MTGRDDGAPFGKGAGVTADLTFLVAGLGLLLAMVLPELLSRWALSAPIVLVGVGLLIGLTPLPDGMPLDPQENRAVIEHLTELTVVVALMGVGLAIDRPLEVAEPRHLATLGCDLAAAGAGDAPVHGGYRRRARLVGDGARAGHRTPARSGARTDRPRASDVQVAGPTTTEEDGGDEVDEEDEVRFALTSEAGLNDGLAFPFVLRRDLPGHDGSGGRLGACAGSRGTSWGVARCWARSSELRWAGPWPGSRSDVALPESPASRRPASRSWRWRPCLLVVRRRGGRPGSYGFVAVSHPVAMTLRSAERGHEYHAAHAQQPIERLERLLTLTVLLLLFGVRAEGNALVEPDVAGRPGRDPAPSSSCDPPPPGSPCSWAPGGTGPGPVH